MALPLLRTSNSLEVLEKKCNITFKMKRFKAEYKQ
jgi:hypothetical protein